MKTIKLYIIAAGLLCLATACAKPEYGNDDIMNTGEENTSSYVVLKAAANNEETKATINDVTGAFTWTDGDQIAVYQDGAYALSTAISSIEGNEAHFTVAAGARSNFAIFPASVRDDSHVGTGNLGVTLPSEYNVTAVNEGKILPPMVSTNEADTDDLIFRQIASLARFQVNNIPSTTTYITFDFNNKKVQGDFALSLVNDVVKPGSSVISTSDTDGIDDIITVKGSTSNPAVTIASALGGSGWTDLLVINLPVPTGEYDKVTVTAYDKSDVPLLSMTRKIKFDGTWSANRAKARKVVTSLPAFSSGGGKKIVVAPGNLYTDGEGNFHISDHPLTHLQFSGAALTAGTVVSRGAFSFNEMALYMTDQTINSETVAVRQDYSFDTYTKTLSIDGGGSFNWRLPSSSEMGQVIVQRTAFGATVNGTSNVTCVRLLLRDPTPSYRRYGNNVGTGPGNYTCPGYLVFPDYASITYPSITSIPGQFSDNIITDEAEFDMLLEMGCLFFPASGYFNSDTGAFTLVGSSMCLGCSSEYYDTVDPYNPTNHVKSTSIKDLIVGAVVFKDITFNMYFPVRDL